MVQQEADTSGREMTADIIWSIYDKEYLNIRTPFSLVSFEMAPAAPSAETEQVRARISHNGDIHEISGSGNGPISAMVAALRQHFDLKFTLADFGQNTRSSTSKAEAAAYVELKNESGKSVFGAGIDTSITKAPILALMSAINRL